MIESLIQHELQQHLLAVLVLKMFGEKLPLQLLCTFVNTSPNEIVLPKHRHLGKTKPLNASDDPIEPLTISEINETESDQIDTKVVQTQNSHCTQNDSTNAPKVGSNNIKM